MLVIGENLSQLARFQQICEQTLVEQFSLTIRLGQNYHETVGGEDIRVVYNNHPDPKTIFSEKKTIEQNVQLRPGGQIIASSAEIYSIPLDHFGLVQTKGTLARLFVQATCGDGQIEPGFRGFITLEIVNLSPWIVEIPKFSAVAQLFLFRASTEVSAGYSGRYSSGALEGPTIPIFTS